MNSSTVRETELLFKKKKYKKIKGKPKMAKSIWPTKDLYLKIFTMHCDKCSKRRQVNKEDINTQ